MWALDQEEFQISILKPLCPEVLHVPTNLFFAAHKQKTLYHCCDIWVSEKSVITPQTNVYCNHPCP